MSSRYPFYVSSLMRSWRTAVSFVAVAIMLVGPRSGADASARLQVDTRDSLEAQIDSVMAKYDGTGSPGAVVGVIRNGDVAFAEGYGMADLAHQVPITSETRFNLGSISKQFLGFAFAMLESQGKLSLDDPVRKYLPDWPEFDQTVTLRHLLTHTSGYREAYGTLALAGRVPGQDFLSREEALEVVRRQPQLEFPAGSKWKYNSTAFVILAEIAERVTGEPSAKWVEENVFGPLRMESSSIETAVGEVIPNAAYSYTDAEKSGYKLETSNRAIFGAAEVYTTVGDLAKWMNNFHTAEVGGRAVQERMRERFVLTSGDTTDYALGVFVDKRRGLRRIQHSGSHAGFRAQLTYYPEMNGGVVVLANYDEVSTGSKARAIAEIAFGEYMEPEQTWKIVETDSVALDSTVLSRYEGTYQTPDGGVFTVNRQKDTLFVEEGRRLFALSDTLFQIENTSDRVSFRAGPNGQVTKATLHESPEEKEPLRRIERWSPTPNELEAFSGRYFSSELETVYAFSVDDGQLVAEHRWHGEVRFTPLKKDTFEAEQGPGMRVQFERNEEGDVTGYDASLGRTSGVWFEKQE